MDPAGQTGTGRVRNRAPTGRRAGARKINKATQQEKTRRRLNVTPTVGTTVARAVHVANPDHHRQTSLTMVSDPGAHLTSVIHCLCELREALVRVSPCMRVSQMRTRASGWPVASILHRGRDEARRDRHAERKSRQAEGGACRSGATRLGGATRR